MQERMVQIISGDYETSHTLNSRFIKRRFTGEAAVVSLVDVEEGHSLESIAVHEVGLANALSHLLMRRGTPCFVDEYYGLLSAEMVSERKRGAYGVSGAEVMDKNHERSQRYVPKDMSKILILFCQTSAIRQLKGELLEKRKCSDEYEALGPEEVIATAGCASDAVRLVIKKQT